MSTNTRQLSIDNIVGVETITDEAASVCSGGAKPPLEERDLILYKHSESPFYPILSYWNTKVGTYRDLEKKTGGAEPGEFSQEVSLIDINEGTWRFSTSPASVKPSSNSEGITSVTLEQGAYDLRLFKNGRFNDTFRTFTRVE